MWFDTLRFFRSFFKIYRRGRPKFLILATTYSFASIPVLFGVFGTEQLYLLKNCFLIVFGFLFSSKENSFQSLRVCAICIFSRRFMKRNGTIIVTPVLHHLAVRTEPKRFFLFFRVTYHTGRDQRVPPFNFFRHCEIFFLNFFYPQGPPSISLIFHNNLGV